MGYLMAIPWFLGYEKVMVGMPTVVAVEVVFALTVDPSPPIGVTVPTVFAEPRTLPPAIERQNAAGINCSLEQWSTSSSAELA